jgi:hypothetical protein
VLRRVADTAETVANTQLAGCEEIDTVGVTLRALGWADQTRSKRRKSWDADVNLTAAAFGPGVKKKRCESVEAAALPSRTQAVINATSMLHSLVMRKRS